MLTVTHTRKHQPKVLLGCVRRRETVARKQQQKQRQQQQSLESVERKFDQGSVGDLGQVFCHVDEDENHGVVMVILVMLLRGIIGAAVERQKLDDPGNGRKKTGHYCGAA